MRATRKGIIIIAGGRVIVRVTREGVVVAAGEGVVRGDEE